MFRTRDSEASDRPSLAGYVVETVTLVALLISLASLALIDHERRVIADLIAGGDAVREEPLQGLRREVRLQLVTTSLVTASLALVLCATWWLRRRYWSSRRALRQVKMLAHDILSSIDRGIVTADRGQAVTSVNSAALRLLEVNAECVGRPLDALSSPSVPLSDVFREVTGLGRPVRGREVVVTRDARPVRLRLDGEVLKDAKGTRVGCVIHLEDTTERMLMEERIRRMEHFLGLSTLASGLHHEIKNPLTALSIHVQLLEESLSHPDRAEAVRECVGVVKTEVCRLNGVLESFRSFAHLQRLTLRPTSPLVVVEEAIRLIRPQAAGQHVQVTLIHPDQDLPRVPLDADKFQQALLNLVINALEAMPGGGTLTVSAATGDGELRVSVADTGPGIPADVRPNVFRPYFSTKDKGTGMGLALCEKLVGQHGGHIDFQTGPGGTTFRMTIPLLQPDGQPWASATSTS